MRLDGPDRFDSTSLIAQAPRATAGTLDVVESASEIQATAGPAAVAGWQRPRRVPDEIRRHELSQLTDAEALAGRTLAILGFG